MSMSANMLHPTEAELRAAVSVWQDQMADAINNLEIYPEYAGGLDLLHLVDRFQFFSVIASTSRQQVGMFWTMLAGYADTLRDICLIEGLRRGVMLDAGGEPREKLGWH